MRVVEGNINLNSFNCDAKAQVSSTLFYIMVQGLHENPELPRKVLRDVLTPGSGNPVV
jgi:hypothetical protein